MAFTYITLDLAGGLETREAPAETGSARGSGCCRTAASSVESGDSGGAAIL
jgi:hypothetical protein